MPRFSPRCNWLSYFLRQSNAKFLVRVSGLCFVACIFWIELGRLGSSPNDTLTEEALKTVAKDSRYAEVYRKRNRLPEGIKYILLWTQRDYAPFYNFGLGMRKFIESNCSMINCYVTDDRTFFEDITKFDAIAFNGRNIQRADLPLYRLPHQKYIYFNTESAANFAVCDKNYDGFFNWTSTYKIDSDIPYPAMLIRNSEGDMVGPKHNMNWLKHMHKIDEEMSNRLENKSKAAAWFVSNCKAKSGRTEFVERLQKALVPYSLSIDVYGKCGPLKCPRSKSSACDAMLQRDYFFYMSLENSFAEDYVTEKLLTALWHDVVPIVFGGANYSRFLPPGSYIDGRAQTPENLAALMYRLMQSPIEYSEYFRWKYHYTYHDPTMTENVCGLCSALNNKTMVEQHRSYDHFREWWNPDHEDQCKKR